MSTLSVDTIQGKTTAGTVAMPAGMIIQTVNSIKTDSSSHNTQNFSDTGLQAVITPKFATSKILISSFCGIVSFSNNNIGKLGLARVIGGTTTYPCTTTGGGLGQSDSATQVTAGFNFGVEDDRTNDTWVCSFLDSPATTSEITYKVQIAHITTSSGTIQFNKWLQDNNKSGVAFLTLQEVKQ